MTTEDVLDRAPGRVDPLGGAAAWGLAPLVSATALGYAVLQTVMHRDEVVYPAFAVVALCLLAAAGIALTAMARPSVGRLGRPTAALIVGAAIAAAVASSIASWGHDRLVQDNWGQIGIGLIIFGLKWLRPPWEIIVYGVVGAVVVGVIAGEQPGMSLVNSPVVYGIVAATPVLLLAAVAATNGIVTLRRSAAWIVASGRGLLALEPEFRMLEQDALRRDQLDELRRTTLPLLASVAERGEITQHDIDTAVTVSAQLRAHALEQARMSWVDRLLATAHISPDAVRDPGRLLPQLPAPERAALSACVLDLLRVGAVRAEGAIIVAAREPATGGPERCRIELTMATAANWRAVRRAAGPFVSVLRSYSGDATITRGESTMTIGFGFVPA